MEMLQNQLHQTHGVAPLPTLQTSSASRCVGKVWQLRAVFVKAYILLVK